MNGALVLMRAGQGIRHGNRLESQFVISNVEERALGCKRGVWDVRYILQDAPVSTQLRHQGFPKSREAHVVRFNYFEIQLNIYVLAFIGKRFRSR